LGFRKTISPAADTLPIARFPAAVAAEPAAETPPAARFPAAVAAEVATATADFATPKAEEAAEVAAPVADTEEERRDAEEFDAGPFGAKRGKAGTEVPRLAAQ